MSQRTRIDRVERQIGKDNAPIPMERVIRLLEEHHGDEQAVLAALFGRHVIENGARQWDIGGLLR